MADLKDNPLVKSVENVLPERDAVAEKEKELVEQLNEVLGRMGYRVVSIDAAGTRKGQQAGGTGRKPGRPPGSGKGQAGKAAGKGSGG